MNDNAPQDENFHYVDAYTGASEIQPYLGSAAGKRPKKRFPWWKIRKKWHDLTGE